MTTESVVTNLATTCRRPIGDGGDNVGSPRAVQRTLFERDDAVGLFLEKPEHYLAVPAHPAKGERELVAVRPGVACDHLGHDDVDARLFHGALDGHPLHLLLHGVGEVLEVAPAASSEMTATGFYTLV